MRNTIYNNLNYFDKILVFPVLLIFKNEILGLKQKKGTEN
jgi:hypothetical protein